MYDKSLFEPLISQKIVTFSHTFITYSNLIDKWKGWCNRDISVQKCFQSCRCDIIKMLKITYIIHFIAIFGNHMYSHWHLRVRRLLKVFGSYLYVNDRNSLWIFYTLCPLFLRVLRMIKYTGRQYTNVDKIIFIYNVNIKRNETSLQWLLATLDMILWNKGYKWDNKTRRLQTIPW